MEKLFVNILVKIFFLNVKVGDLLQEGDIIIDVICINQKKMSMVLKELFGFLLIVCVILFYDENGRVIGGVGFGMSFEELLKLYDVVESLLVIVE